MPIIFTDSTMYLSATGTADIFVPSGTVGHIHNISIHNSSPTGTATITLNKKVSTTNWQLFKVDVDALESVMFEYAGEGLLIKSNNKLTGSTNFGSAVVIDVSCSDES